jgi:hypothetical protein
MDFDVELIELGTGLKADATDKGDDKRCCTVQVDRMPSPTRGKRYRTREGPQGRPFVLTSACGSRSNLTLLGYGMPPYYPSKK